MSDNSGGKSGCSSSKNSKVETAGGESAGIGTCGISTAFIFMSGIGLLYGGSFSGRTGLSETSKAECFIISISYVKIKAKPPISFSVNFCFKKEKSVKMKFLIPFN